jgi:hypothetical protein
MVHGTTVRRGSPNRLRRDGSSDRQAPPISANLTSPTTVTLCTDSAVVYHTLNKGAGSTLRYSTLLKNLYIQYLINKVKSGHGVVVPWVPSAENLADPLSRGVLAP